MRDHRKSQTPREAADQQEDHRAEHRDTDRSWIEVPLRDGSPAEVCTDQASDESADDTEKNREDAARGIATRHEELRQGTDDEPEADPVEPERHARGRRSR